MFIVTHLGQVIRVMIEISKNAMERIRFQTTKYQGKQLIDIRVWVPGEDDELIPTRKGLTFSVVRFREFRRALDELEIELISAGLIDESNLEFVESESL